MELVAERDPAELARLWQGVRNGSQPDCVSAYGVHDLPGNVEELVASETYSGPYGALASVLAGGNWYRGARNQCRSRVYSHDEGFYYYFVGFRCCAEADGEPTDPRAPKQVTQRRSFDRVEKLARFGVDEVKAALNDPRACACQDDDVQCKTLCGSLLGPDAREAVRGTSHGQA